MKNSINIPYLTKAEHKLNKIQTLYLAGCFMLLFCAYGACSNLVSQLFDQIGYKNLGQATLSSLYLGYSLMSFFSAYVIEYIFKNNFKVAFCVATIGYNLFIIFGFILVGICYEDDDDVIITSKFCDKNVVYPLGISASFITGMSASIIWIAQGGYFDLMNIQVKDNQKGDYLSIFYGVFQTSGVIGGVISIFTLNVNNFYFFMVWVIVGFLSFLSFLFAKNPKNRQQIIEQILNEKENDDDDNNNNHNNKNFDLQQQNNIEKDIDLQQENSIENEKYQENIIRKKSQDNIKNDLLNSEQKQQILQQNSEINENQKQQSVCDGLKAIFRIVIKVKQIYPLLVLMGYTGFQIAFIQGYMYLIIDNSLSFSQKEFVSTENQYITAVFISQGLFEVIGGYIAGKVANKFKLKILIQVGLLFSLITIGLSWLNMKIKVYWVCFIMAAIWGFCDCFLTSICQQVCSLYYPGRLEVMGLFRIFQAFSVSVMQIVIIVVNQDYVIIIYFVIVILTSLILFALQKPDFTILDNYLLHSEGKQQRTESQISRKVSFNKNQE